MKTKVTVSEHIKASREKVFLVWTRPDLAGKWICPEGMTVKKFTSDVRPGGKWASVMSDGQDDFSTEGTYLEVIPNEKLVYTWDEEGPTNPITRVTVTFKEKDGGTLVTVHHDRFMDEETADAHEGGWTSMLEALARAFL
jgi:uncharacterized protein YndB with AHSA1/START domain